MIRSRVLIGLKGLGVLSGEACEGLSWRLGVGVDEVGVIIAEPHDSLAGVFPRVDSVPDATTELLSILGVVRSVHGVSGEGGDGKVDVAVERRQPVRADQLLRREVTSRGRVLDFVRHSGR